MIKQDREQYNTGTFSAFANQILLTMNYMHKETSMAPCVYFALGSTPWLLNGNWHLYKTNIIQGNMVGMDVRVLPGDIYQFLNVTV